MGRNCKYSGGNNYHSRLVEFLKDKEVVEVCPEVLGGLPIPRPRAEIVNGVVMNEYGESVDEAFRRGAEAAMRKIQGMEIDLAVLQSRSPSCGARQVYDGTFSGVRIDGQGVFARMLMEAGYRVMDVEEFGKADDDIQQ